MTLPLLYMLYLLNVDSSIASINLLNVPLSTIIWKLYCACESPRDLVKRQALIQYVQGRA